MLICLLVNLLSGTSLTFPPTVKVKARAMKVEVPAMTIARMMKKTKVLILPTITASPANKVKALGKALGKAKKKGKALDREVVSLKSLMTIAGGVTKKTASTKLQSNVLRRL